MQGPGFETSMFACIRVGGTNKHKKTAQFLMLFLLRLLYGYALGTENCSLMDTFLVLLNVLKPFVF